MSIPYDPDFDAPQTGSAGVHPPLDAADKLPRYSTFDAVSSRAAFIAGVVASVLIIGTIGFFVLLTLLLAS